MFAGGGYLKTLSISDFCARCFKLKKRFAFTVAELLIVMAILGIVTALMTPIYRAINKHLVSVEARRGQQLIENVFNQMRASMGEYYLWPNVTSRLFLDEFEKHLKIESKNLTQKQYPCENPSLGASRYLLSNGMVITLSTYCYGDPKATGKRMLIAFDTNGAEKPNLPGVDIFAMSFNKDPNNTTLHPYGIYPAGHNLPDGEDLAYGCRGLAEGFAYWYFFPNMHNHTCLEYLNRSNFKIDDSYPIKNFGKRF